MKSKSILLLACGLLFIGSTALALDLPTGQVTTVIGIETDETLAGSGPQDTVVLQRGGYEITGGATLSVRDVTFTTKVVSPRPAIAVKDGVLDLGDGASVNFPKTSCSGTPKNSVVADGESA